MAINDIDLKQLIIDNPEQGLSAALELYAPLVKSIVCRLLGTENRQDTEECIADIFFKLYRGIAAFDPTAGTIKGYLCGIARHTALDYRRKTAEQMPCLRTESRKSAFTPTPPTAWRQKPTAAFCSRR